MRKLIMYIGLPNSGKSTHAETFAKEHNYVIVKTNEELLRELDKEESRVIFDNYNNVRSNRIKLIELLKDKFEDLFISGFYMATDLDTILKREAKKENANEDFVFEVIKKTSVPHMNEGFDNLELIGFDRFKTREIYFDKPLSYQDYIKKVLSYPIINKTIELPHDNHDNVFSVSRHMFYAYQNISKLTDNKQLIAAAMLHDVGKGITKRTSDNVYADATFDGHVNVSAQLAVLYLLNCGISKEEIFKIVFYIQNHILIKEYENNPNKKNELEKLLGCEIQNLKLLEIVNQSVK